MITLHSNCFHMPLPFFPNSNTFLECRGCESSILHIHHMTSSVTLGTVQSECLSGACPHATTHPIAISCPQDAKGHELCDQKRLSQTCKSNNSREHVQRSTDMWAIIKQAMKVPRELRQMQRMPLRLLGKSHWRHCQNLKQPTWCDGQCHGTTRQTYWLSNQWKRSQGKYSLMLHWAKQ